MSYNIDTFKLKKIKLTLPKGFSMVEFEKEQRKTNYCDEIVVLSSGSWGFNTDHEGLSIAGHCDESGNLIVDMIECAGDFSGGDYTDLLIPLVKKFNGEIHCVTIWEGGDSIKDLKIKNGKVAEKNVEL